MNRIRYFLFFLLVVSNLVLVLFSCSGKDKQGGKENGATGEIKKVKDIVIYEDPLFYSSFPSIVKNDEGEFITAFRRAPDRRIFGEKGNSHTDPNSYLVMVRSKDGETWTTEPELIYAHPFGGHKIPAPQTERWHAALHELRVVLCGSRGNR